MAARRRIEWSKIGEFIIVFLVIPTFIFWGISIVWPPFLTFSYYFIVTLFVIEAFLIDLQTVGAWTKPTWEDRPDHEVSPVPKTTFIVSAYLPNEVEVIEATLLNILQNVERPKDGIEVILAYNTPHMVELELRLRELAYKHPELILANAYNSRSKCENLNYTLDLASGEMIVLLDADHQPRPDCLKRAWRWLAEGYDVVQGRCSIRNGDAGLTAALVSVEFQCIYGVSHFAKSRMFHTALFGGTNGYWRASVLKAARFNKGMLTEDIDATLRSILAGRKFVHDRNIISTELAPEDLTGLWFQRKRWSQGWFQCALKHQWALLKCKHLGFRGRFIWTVSLLWGNVYNTLSHLLFPVLVAFWLHEGHIYFPMTPYIWFALVFTTISGPFETIVAYKSAEKPRAPIRRYVFHALMALPYTIFKNVIQVISMRDEFLGKKEWVTTVRTKQPMA